MSTTTIPNHTIPFIPASRPESKWEPTPKGTYSGRLIRVYDCGEIGELNKKTEKLEYTQRISLVFEIDHREEGQEKNRFITMYPMKYSYYHKSNMAKMLSPWLDTVFPHEESKIGIDWERVMDMEVDIQVGHRESVKDGKTTFYDEILTLAKPKKGSAPFYATQDQWMWSVTQDPGCKLAEELKIPKYIIDIAKNSLQFKKAEQDRYEREAGQVFDKSMQRRTGGEAPMGYDGKPAF